VTLNTAFRRGRAPKFEPPREAAMAALAKSWRQEGETNPAADKDRGSGVRFHAALVDASVLRR
jgi:hypothetical protein